VEPIPETLLPRLLQAAARRRRRARVVLAGIAAIAAAAVVALAVVLWPTASPDSGRPASFAMKAVPGAPVAASVQLVDKRWGTEVDVRCSYFEQPGRGTPTPYLLVVYGKDGIPQTIGRWKLGPGQSGRFTSPTDLDHDEITRIAIQLSDRRTVLSLDL
jgi:hypothetical protein